MSEHAGMPVLKGEKYAFNLWFRECHRYVLYKDFNPIYYEDGESILKEKIRLQVESIQRKEENYSKIIQKYNLHNKLSDQLTEVTKNVYVKENALSDSLVENIQKKCNFKNLNKRESCWVNRTAIKDVTNEIESLIGITNDYFEILMQ